MKRKRFRLCVAPGLRRSRSKSAEIKVLALRGRNQTPSGEAGIPRNGTEHRWTVTRNDPRTRPEDELAPGRRQTRFAPRGEPGGRWRQHRFGRSERSPKKEMSTCPKGSAWSAASGSGPGLSPLTEEKPEVYLVVIYPAMSGGLENRRRIDALANARKLCARAGDADFTGATIN